jgi:hypothetical protein
MLRGGYPTECVDGTQNHDKMAGIPNQKYFRKEDAWYFKNENELNNRIVATRRKRSQKFVWGLLVEKIIGLKLYSKNLNLKRRSI